MSYFEKFISGDLDAITVSNESISRTMFAKMSALKQVNFTNLKVLEEYAFCNCFSLDTVKMSKVEEIKSNAFEGCLSLKTLIIENESGVSTLGKNAFDRCIHFFCDSKDDAIAQLGEDIDSAPPSITEAINSIDEKTGFIYVPDKLIGDYKSSKDWSFLKDRIFPISAIQEGCDPDSLETGKKGVRLSVELDYLTREDLFELESSAKQIADGMFFNTKLSKGEFGDAIYVGVSSFEQCFDLKSIELPSAEKIQKDAFHYCISLEEINLPNVKTIEKRAFNKCQECSVISVPKVEIIAERAFRECFKIKQVDTPLLREIGKGAFEKCAGLECLSVPQLKRVGEYAFFKCTHLETVVLPEIEVLEKKAFAGCYRLKEIVLPNTEHVCKIEQQVFDDCCNIWGTSYGIHHPSEEDEGRIFVADNLLEDYLNDPGWEGIGHCIRPISEQLGDAEEDVQSEKIEHFEGEELLESEGASQE